jgi:uncharacterized protein (TIGR02996 family)
MPAKTQQEGFLEAIAADPYDNSLRLIYRDWLLENGDRDEAHQQKWISYILTGQVTYGLVITWEGILEVASKWPKKLPPSRRRVWLKRAAYLFEQAPMPQRGKLLPVFTHPVLVIVDSRAKMQLNLRRDPKRTSPVLFFREAETGMTEYAGQVAYYRWRGKLPLEEGQKRVRPIRQG